MCGGVCGCVWGGGGGGYVGVWVFRRGTGTTRIYREKRKERTLYTDHVHTVYMPSSSSKLPNYTFLEYVAVHHLLHYRLLLIKEFCTRENT